MMKAFVIHEETMNHHQSACGTRSKQVLAERRRVGLPLPRIEWMLKSEAQGSINRSGGSSSLINSVTIGSILDPAEVARNCLSLNADCFMELMDYLFVP